MVWVCWHKVSLLSVAIEVAVVFGVLDRNGVFLAAFCRCDWPVNPCAPLIVWPSLERRVPVSAAGCFQSAKIPSCSPRFFSLPLLPRSPRLSQQSASLPYPFHPNSSSFNSIYISIKQAACPSLCIVSLLPALPPPSVLCITTAPTGCAIPGRGHHHPGHWFPLFSAPSHQQNSFLPVYSIKSQSL